METAYRKSPILRKRIMDLLKRGTIEGLLIIAKTKELFDYLRDNDNELGGEIVKMLYDQIPIILVNHPEVFNSMSEDDREKLFRFYDMLWMYTPDQELRFVTGSMLVALNQLSVLPITKSTRLMVSSAQHAQSLGTPVWLYSEIKEPCELTPFAARNGLAPWNVVKDYPTYDGRVEAQRARIKRITQPKLSTSKTP